MSRMAARSAAMASALVFVGCDSRHVATDPPATQPPVAVEGGGSDAAPAPPQAVAKREIPYRPAEVRGMVRVDDKAYMYSPAKWPRQPGRDTTPVRVCWEQGSPTGPEREWVREAVVSSWQAHSKLRFLGFVDCVAASAGVRIEVRDDGPENGPHAKELGRFLDGEPNGIVLNFTFRTWNPGCAVSADVRERCVRTIAVHEFGHAIAFAHEQNRPDTPGECAIRAQGQNGDLLLTPYDPASVMNYCNEELYSSGGRLSPDDIDAVKKEYGS
jgi:hypothetical protein